MCPYRFTQKIQSSCVFCENVYIDYFYSRYKNNPTCSHDCYGKNYTIPFIDCKNSSLKTNASLGCSSCYDLNKLNLKKYNPEELPNLANKYKFK